MSGWIKMGTGLRRHPKVVRIASALNADRLRIIGGLHGVWCVFDEHSRAGRLDGYTPEALDEEIGWPGFSRAMQAVGWLIVDAEGIEAPSYEEHNGPNAKRRALDATRKATDRASSGDDPPPKRKPVRTVSASDADKTRTREEKRREEETQGDKLPVLRASAPTKPTKKAPESFEVTDELRQWAAEQAPGVDINAETAKLRDHTFATARTDWPGTWRNWMRKAAERPPGGLRLAHPQQQAIRLTRGEEVMAQSMPFESLAPHVQAVVRARRGAASADLPLVETIDAPVARITG